MGRCVESERAPDEAAGRMRATCLRDVTSAASSFGRARVAETSTDGFRCENDAFGVVRGAKASCCEVGEHCGGTGEVGSR
jgi:hypothetical protein